MAHKITMYETLRDMLEGELSNIEKKGSIDPTGLENIYKLTSSIKNIDKRIYCLKMEEQEEDNGESYGRNGYSRDYWPRRYYRDSPYIHMQDDGMMDRRYSRDESRKKMVQKLETLMDDTLSEHERAAIQDCIARINA